MVIYIFRLHLNQLLVVFDRLVVDGAVEIGAGNRHGADFFRSGYEHADTIIRQSLALLFTFHRMGLTRDRIVVFRKNVFHLGRTGGPLATGLAERGAGENRRLQGFHHLRDQRIGDSVGLGQVALLEVVLVIFLGDDVEVARPVEGLGQIPLELFDNFTVHIAFRSGRQHQDFRPACLGHKHAKTAGSKNEQAG